MSENPYEPPCANVSTSTRRKRYVIPLGIAGLGVVLYGGLGTIAWFLNKEPPPFVQAIVIVVGIIVISTVVVSGLVFISWLGKDRDDAAR